MVWKRPLYCEESLKSANEVSYYINTLNNPAYNPICTIYYYKYYLSE